MDRFFKKTLVICFILFLASSLLAQRQTGSIKGTVTDAEGQPLPGVSLTISSPDMLGVITYVTGADGHFRAPAVPPGVYTIVAEVPGFQTLRRGGIIVHVGMTAEITLELSVAAVEEEVTVVGASPVVDVEASKIAVTMTAELMRNIPMARDLYDIVTSAPGVVSDGVAFRRTSSIHGSTVRGNTYALDGVNMNDPVVAYASTNLNFDVMQEVEMVLAGHPAETGYTDGGYINVVTKSGGNRFSGGANLLYTSDTFANILIPDPQLRALGVSKPEIALSDYDVSGILGGPFLKDRIWFFANFRYIANEYISPFRPTTILGKSYESFNLDHTEYLGFLKLTTQFTQSLKFMGMVNYAQMYEPQFRLDKGWNITKEAYRVWDNETGLTGTAIFNWVIDPNTFVDLRGGYVRRFFPLPLQPESVNNPVYYDYFTAYQWGSARFNETYLRKRFQASAALTRFQDGFLGGNHEFKAGVEFEDAYGDWNWWRSDSMWWSYWNGNPLWSKAQGLARSTFGDGRLFFYICATEKDKSVIKDQAQRIGGFIQDTATFMDRLTLNLGVRIDYSYGFKPAVTKGRSNALAYAIGETYFVPRYGINPYGELTTGDWKDIIKWTSISPRFGLTYDIFGEGKTVLKASFSRYTEYLMLQYFSVLHPFYPRTFTFYWFDNDGDSIPDLPPTDTYLHTGTTPDVMKFEFSRDKMDPNTKSPYTDELTISIQHELMKDFSIQLGYIYKNKENILEDVLYDPASKRYWYTYEKATDWWVPFTTTLPAHDIFPSKKVDMYFLSRNAPAIWYTFANIPEGQRRYQAFELILNKRFSDGWQLGGSVVFSKFEGNIGGSFGDSWGWSGAFDNANWWINRFGRLDFDRPLVIKLFGTFTLPYKVYFSFLYQHYDGSPWGRSATVFPPSGWAAANNVNTAFSYGIMVETPGERRLQGSDVLDLRAEKEFDLGNFGRIGFYVDAFNVLGFNRVSIGQNVGGTWRPTDNNVTTGTFTPAGTYKVITGVEATRLFKFSIRYSF